MLDKSSFYEDLNKENLFSSFLMNNCYNHIDFPFYVVKNDNLDLQFKGIDYIFESKIDSSIRFNVDEKVASNYCSIKNLNTFGVELLSNTRSLGNLCTGWFLKESKETDYFIFGWPERSEGELCFLEYNDILEIDIMLLNKNRLIELIFDKYNLNLDMLYNHSCKVVTKVPNRKNKLDDYFNGARFCHSRNLYEKPINLLIDKMDLKSVCEFYYKVKNDSVFLDLL